MLTVLMIDDQQDVIDTIKEHLEEADKDIAFESAVDFDTAADHLKRVRPDVVILDWFEGNPATGAPEGKNLLNDIWKKWFCPVVIYSAGAVDLSPLTDTNHPFVVVQQKGGGTEKAVAKKLAEFRPHVDALKNVAEELEGAKRAVLRDLSRTVFQALTDTDQRKEVLRRAARRRIAAIVDDLQHLTLEDQNVLPWEQYIFPVLSSHPLTGDVLFVVGADKPVPASFRVILTPTCDLVPRKGVCKVGHVLAAKCVDPKKFVTDGLNLAAGTSQKKIEDALGRAMNEPQQSGFVIYPACAGRIPLMALDLRDLELIPTSEIGKEDDAGKKYHRIASVDSPFREFIAWGFLQIGCRPGIPPRDMSALISGLAGLCAPPVGSKG